jgi:predicted DNA-binding transcriptional regulator AlpA
MSDNTSSRRYLPDPKVCERYGITSMTLWRWDHDPLVNFPKPIRIKRRKYRDEAELVEWERSQATARWSRVPA